MFMKDIRAVLYSLIVLLAVELNPDSSSPSVNNQERISDIGLRFAFKRKAISASIALPTIVFAS
jgi:hypothetical protein